MDNFEKELKRKITIRKTAIQNTAMHKNTENIKSDENCQDDKVGILFNILNENINEANNSSIQTWHWIINGRKSSIFIKKVLRKIAKTLYGWIIFPVMSRQSHFNGKAVNSLSLLKDIVYSQNLLIDKLIKQFSTIECKVQSELDKVALINQQDLGKFYSEIEKLIYVYHEDSINSFSDLEDRITTLYSEEGIKLKNDLVEKINLQEQNRIINNNELEFKIQLLQNQLKVQEQELLKQQDEIERRFLSHNIISIENQDNDYRMEVKKFNSNQIIGVNDYKLHEKVMQIAQASMDELDEKIKDATDYFNEVLKENVINKTISKRKLIIVFCMRFKSEHGLEAIKNEAYDLFQLLSKQQYNVKLLSLEQSPQLIDLNNNIIFVDRDNIEKCITSLAPELIILCESTPYNVFDFDGIFIKNHTLIKLTGQNPLQGLSKMTLDELRHCNDYGIHRYLVESKNAYDIMKDYGFRDVILSYPVVDINRVTINKRSKDYMNNFIVGFASSPMDDQSYKNRGIEFIIHAIAGLPNLSFKILWRNENIAIPKEFLEAKNCEIVIGKYDMKQFYQEIDCLLIPYKSINNNHACSLSGIEAMLNGIPVVCTNVSGISEIVESTGMGIICEPSAEEITRSIDKLYKNYDVYNGMHKSEVIRQLFSSKQIVTIIDNTLDGYFPKNFVTLDQWNACLLAKNKYLVKGHDSIKEYYRNSEVANSYNEVRFLQFPTNYFDAFERVSIGIIITSIFGKCNLKILDIASGDGRIVQEVIKYGYCTSIDSSRAMLDIVEKRFGATNKVTTEICDYFIDTLNNQYDVITTFRYIRHFDYKQRMELYHKIFLNLNKGGILIFDAPNIRYAMKNRERGNWDDFNIYDVFWDENSIVQELNENNFEVIYLLPIGVKSIENEPVSWTVAALKR